MFKYFKFLPFVAFLMMLAEPTLAASASSMPWAGGIAAFQASITGEIAMAIALAGIVLSGAALIFGGELNGFARSFFLIILVVALLVGANAVITSVFGATTAVI